MDKLILDMKPIIEEHLDDLKTKYLMQYQIVRESIGLKYHFYFEGYESHLWILSHEGCIYFIDENENNEEHKIDIKFINKEGVKNLLNTIFYNLNKKYRLKYAIDQPRFFFDKVVNLFSHILNNHADFLTFKETVFRSLLKHYNFRQIETELAKVIKMKDSNFNLGHFFSIGDHMSCVFKLIDHYFYVEIFDKKIIEIRDFQDRKSTISYTKRRAVEIQLSIIDKQIENNTEEILF